MERMNARLGCLNSLVSILIKIPAPDASDLLILRHPALSWRQFWSNDPGAF